MNAPRLLPDDEYNQELVAQAHPVDWQNPSPSGVYNLVVIGGGTAGMIAALGTAGLGGRVALVERHLLGGDCLNYGCVPSKALLRAARAVYDASQLREFGIEPSGDAKVDFAAVMQRMRRLRASISHHDSAQRFTRLGVDVYFGQAKFLDGTSVQVGEQTLRFRRCILATGARPAVPQVEGLEAAGYLTNETIFSLTQPPARLLILGGGPIGCELALAFRRLGSDVLMIHRGSQLLPKEEPDAAALVQAQLQREGVQVFTSATVRRFEKVIIRAIARQRAMIDCGERSETVEVDAILVATGRSPNVDDLQLETAGVEYSERGVVVDDFFRTSNRQILAAGDILGGPQFTHAADAMARACIQNAFFFGCQRLSRLVIPRTTFTDPEVASIGLNTAQCAQQNLAIDTYRQELQGVDRAVLDGETQGFALVHTRQGTGRVVGATIVARHAGEMIGELSLLMTNSLSLGALAKTVHCYPTQAEVLKRLADQYQRSRLTPTLAGWLKWILQSR